MGINTQKATEKVALDQQLYIRKVLSHIKTYTLSLSRLPNMLLFWLLAFPFLFRGFSYIKLSCCPSTYILLWCVYMQTFPIDECTVFFQNELSIQLYLSCTTNPK